jgi:acetyl-CoA C-acetyltransferase
VAEAYIIDAVRTPVGRRNGGLSAEHPADIGAHAIKGLIDRTGIDPGAVDDCIMGCLDTVGPQSFDVARTAWLAAGLPESIPGVTIDRQCGSSQQAVSFAAMGVMAGVQDLVVAGGLQNMSMIPIQSSGSVMDHALIGHPEIADPLTTSKGWAARYGDQEISQFRGAELIAERWGFGREDLERFALESHERAARAQDEGRFDNEILPYGEISQDEGVRRGGTLEKMAELKTLRPGGVITAGVASQISDGAAALLIAGERAVKDHDLEPRARIHHISVRGDDPVFMLLGPIAATKYALEKSGMSIDDIDLFECNEAFAPVPMAWMAECAVPSEKVNVNGGAIALGHPLGATGARLMTTLLNELERTGGRYGLQTMCEGGGQANVTIIEVLR